jgi:pyruvyltransferase
MTARNRAIREKTRWPMTKLIKLYWWRPKEAPANYGDALSPFIVEAMARKPVAYTKLRWSDLVAIGSILQVAYTKTSSIRWKLRSGPLRVWGSGTLRPIDGGDRSGFAVFAVRGPATRAALGLPEETPLGDPALLIGEMVAMQGKRFRWGIVPHMVHRHDADEALSHLSRTLPRSTIIDVTHPDVTETTKLIQSCDFIASSSLHGVIVADALGIPNVWVRLCDPANFDFKFDDYFRSVGRASNPITDWRAGPGQFEKAAATATESTVAERCTALRRAFSDMNL